MPKPKKPAAKPAAAAPQKQIVAAALVVSKRLIEKAQAFEKASKTVKDEDEVFMMALGEVFTKSLAASWLHFADAYGSGATWPVKAPRKPKPSARAKRKK